MERGRGRARQWGQGSCGELVASRSDRPEGRGQRPGDPSHENAGKQAWTRARLREGGVARGFRVWCEAGKDTSDCTAIWIDQHHRLMCVVGSGGRDVAEMSLSACAAAAVAVAFLSVTDG